MKFKNLIVSLMPLVKHPSRTPKISCNCLLISTHGQVHDRAFDLINDFVTVKSKRLGLLFVTSFKPFIPAFNSIVEIKNEERIQSHCV